MTNTTKNPVVAVVPVVLVQFRIGHSDYTERYDSMARAGRRVCELREVCDGRVYMTQI